MKKVNENDIDIKTFDLDTYILVYNEKDWDGGRICEMSLKTKSDFFDIASQMSDVLFDIFDFYGEENIIVGPFNELSNYCRWKNINDFELVQELKQQLKPKKYYLVNTEEDKALIEKLIEGNMRYLTQVYFYLPTKQILIQAGHHTAFAAYSENLETLNSELTSIISNHNGWHCELESFYENR